jgi:hypothetical protein
MMDGVVHRLTGFLLLAAFITSQANILIEH